MATERQEVKECWREEMGEVVMRNINEGKDCKKKEENNSMMKNK